MKSPLFKLVFKLVWLITALGSLHLGLLALGYDVPMMLGLSELHRTLMYTFGLAGAVSLVLLAISCHCHMNHKENCRCC